MGFDISRICKIGAAGAVAVLAFSTAPALAQGQGVVPYQVTPTVPSPTTGIQPASSSATAPGLNAALIAANCAVCHGPSGAGAGDIAKINEQTAAQIAENMRAFRDGKKPSTIMGRIVKGYSDAQITAVANQLGKK